MNRPVITLCGSTRFKNQFNDANFWLTMDGKIVLSVGSFLHSDNDPEIKDVIIEHKQELDQLHKDKIDMSFAILVIDVDNYVGESTRLEIEHAIKNLKTVYSYRLSKEFDPKLRHLIIARSEMVWDWIDPKGQQTRTLQ